MRQGCRSKLVVCASLLWFGSGVPATAEGPFARLRQRLRPQAAAPVSTTVPSSPSASIQELIDAQTVVVSPSAERRSLGTSPASPPPLSSIGTQANFDRFPGESSGITRTGLLEPAPAPASDLIAPLADPPLSDTTSPWAAEGLSSAGLTLEQAEQYALANNPSLKQAGAIVQKARGTRQQIGRYPNPTIGYSGEEIGDEGTAGNQGMFVQQTIVLGRKLELNERVADWETQSLNWQAEAQRQRVRNDVRKQFYVMLGAQRRVILAEQLQQVANAGAHDAQQRFQAIGDLTRVDVVQATVQAQEVEIIRANAYVQREAAWKQLVMLMGTPGMARVELADVLEQTSGPRDADLARDQLLSLSPVLAQAKADVQRAAWRIQRERAQPIPNVDLQLVGAHMNASGSDAVSVQVGLPVPLFNRNDGNILRASAEYQRACWNVQRLELSLQSQLAESFQQYQVAANQVEIYRNQILPQLTDAITLIEENPSTFANLPMIIVRRSYFESQLNELQALIDLRTAEVDLDGLLLTGAFNELVDNELDDSNRWNALSGQ